MIDYRKLKNWAFEEVHQTYDQDFTMLYALGLGIGSDPVDEHALRFVNDTMSGTPLALPTLCTVVGFPGSWMRHPETGIDALRMVHGEELIEMHAPMPASASMVARHRVTRIVDKGPGRGATVTYEKDLFESATRLRIATVTHTTFCRGDGGFSATDGVCDVSPPPPRKPPDGPPDKTLDHRTMPQQALIYRLLADRNPLHSDPGVARAAGFERPILHGLCTYGIAAYALVSSWCSGHPAGLKSLFCRFSAPVLPGETVRTEMYRCEDGIAFRARVLERDVIALDYGFARITE
jgi:acyl dehydratase